jgi:hypothetical protein
MTGLLNIPFETLQQVCELVAGARPSNLIPFSEVSKECLAASSQSLWRTIPLEITSRDQIPRRVHRLKHVLRTRLSRNARIRCISITSDQPLRDREDKESNISRLERAYLDNIAWQPLADVLAKIPPLSDMEWEKDELPPCILQPLNSRHHNCRLRIVKVKCAAIEDPDLHNRPTARPIFMYELLLPLQNDYILRRENISRRGAGNGSAGCFDLAIVGTLSASLTQLRYRDTYSSEHHRVQQIDSSEFELVSRQRIGPRARYKAATLSTLDLTSQKPLDKRQEIRRSGIVMWSTLTRLPALRTLKSSLVFHSDALEYLTAKGILGSLKTLDIVIHSRSKSQRPDILVGFLRSLPPLENLALAGEIHTARCEDWMSCHASSLKRLQLMPLKYCDGTFDLVSLSLILKPPLPLLEHLTITLKRSKGDLDEVGMYKILGAMPRPQSIVLGLDASISSHSEF